MYLEHLVTTLSNNLYLCGHCSRMRVTSELLRLQNFSLSMPVEFPGKIHHLLRAICTNVINSIFALCRLLIQAKNNMSRSHRMLGWCHWYTQGGAASPALISRNICQCGHLDLRCYCKKAACEKASFQTLWMQQLFYKGFILSSL